LETEHQYFLFVDQPLDELAHFKNVTVVQAAATRPTTEAAVVDGNRAPSDLYRLYRAVAASPIDIMFFPAVYSWFPVPRKLPTMVTVFDAIAEHYPKLIFPHWKGRLFWAIKMKCAIWASQRILTVSHAAKAEITEYIGADPDTIDITSAAPNAIFRQCRDDTRIKEARLSAKLPVDAPVIVFVGGLAPHKNLHGLLDGFEMSLSKGHLQHVHLALVGDFKGAGFFSNYDSLNDRVQASPELRDRVHFSGYVADSDLVAIYSSALAVAMPSYSEGFGLPAIEAMACSAPVLSSNRGSLPEVVGDAGVYFDPFDIQAISAALIEIVENEELRASLSSKALERAKGFTWPRAARSTLSHLEALVQS
jgi:glycosyltransferase involved in cell wall biosynthesis